MTTATDTQLRSLPLLHLHRARGAKIAAFAGWEVPIYFTSILEEHEQVRSRAGLFDISHMGYFTFSGKDTRKFFDCLLTANLSRLAPGGAVYSLMTKESGGIVDDVILYQRDENNYFLIVNAGTREKDWGWITSHQGSFDVRMKDESFGKVLLALQGPKSEQILTQLFKTDLSKLRRFQFAIVRHDGHEIILSRTGYTGEDGFEILAPLSYGETLWEALLKTGDALPIGFGARDTLRLEARYPLYGHDMDETTTPLEAGLGWAVDVTKTFPGSGVIRAQKEKGFAKRMTGFEVLGRSIPREGYEMYLNGKPAGKVTSGGMSPSLKKNIGLSYVDSPVPVKEGLEIQIRNERVPCRAVKGPFYVGESLKRFQKSSKF